MSTWRLDLNEDNVVVARRQPHSMWIALFPTKRLSFGLTLHRSGGLSLVGAPKAGGTTLCWGRKLKDFMEQQVRPECTTKVDIGPLTVYSGEDF